MRCMDFTSIINQNEAEGVVREGIIARILKKTCNYDWQASYHSHICSLLKEHKGNHKCDCGAQAVQ